MNAIEGRLNGRAVSADLLRDVMLSCDQFVQSRTRQEYRKLVAPGFLARGLATAIRKAGAHPDVCGIAEVVAHGLSNPRGDGERSPGRQARQAVAARSGVPARRTSYY